MANERVRRTPFDHCLFCRHLGDSANGCYKVCMVYKGGRFRSPCMVYLRMMAHAEGRIYGTNRPLPPLMEMHREWRRRHGVNDGDESLDY